MTTFHYNRDDLKRFRQGVPVEVLSPRERDVIHVGHVQGFSFNITTFAIDIVVMCEDQTPRSFRTFDVQLMD